MPRRSQQPSTRPPYERMMFIHEQLKREAYPNCNQISRHFDKDRRTILRDIEFMTDRLNLPISYDQQRRGYYYTRPVAQFPGLSLSESELFSILVAEKAIANYRGTPFHKPLINAFNHLTEVLGEKAVVHLRGLGEAMDIRLTGPDALDEENFEIVMRAVQQGRPLSFSYRKQAGKTLETRNLHPYQLVCANNRWYVIGQDEARQAIRIFVLSRMSDPEILPGHFNRPADFKIADYLKGSFGIFKGENDYEVVIDLDNWAADVLRNRRWHESQQIVELPGGGMRASFHLDNLEEVEQWVLSWGIHAVVVRPKALAGRVQAAAQGIMELYHEPSGQSGSTKQEQLGLRSG
jgi:predicted DNA-binding transcriptional regulator YafY